MLRNPNGDWLSGGNSGTTVMSRYAVSGYTGRHAYPQADDFVQPRALYRKVMTDVDRDHLIGNIVDHLRGARK